ncbi:hypothetical protein DPEC_G00142770 [Dallia pectoralis]|uniref:Uncharacterized protein n=1 Tax=Dallia pectoralis TaxID=75939 RepID=A0ACC2GNP1_DALPE|nr:hypothetical protein DPEC_G00142770 [Dallia pectoralis]
MVPGQSAISPHQLPPMLQAAHLIPFTHQNATVLNSRFYTPEFAKLFILHGSRSRIFPTRYHLCLPTCAFISLCSC